MTTVWLFEPRSHGRRKEVARARNGAPLPGRRPSSHLLAPSIGVSGFVSLWARSIFSSSCVVVRANLAKILSCRTDPPTSLVYGGWHGKGRKKK